MKLLLSLFAPCALVACLFALPARAADPVPEYDLLITNGRVADGTGNPWFHGAVAIKGDKIVLTVPIQKQGMLDELMPLVRAYKPALMQTLKSG